MARGKALEASQRVLVTIGADMKQQADELFELQGISFSEGVRRALGLLLSSQAKQAVTVDSKTLRQAEKALSAMGMDVDTAVSVFDRADRADGKRLRAKRLTCRFINIIIC